MKWYAWILTAIVLFRLGHYIFLAAQSIYTGQTGDARFLYLVSYVALFCLVVLFAVWDTRSREQRAKIRAFIPFLRAH